LTPNFVLANGIVTRLGKFLKAIRIHHYGGVEQLRYEETADPKLDSPDDVIVRLKAAAVNYSDIQVRQGTDATRTCLPEEVAAVVAECTSSHGVDVALELTGSPESFETLLPQLRLGGTAVLVGSVFPSRPVPLLLEQVVRRCLTLRGVHNYAPRHLHAALVFLANHHDYPFDTLVADWQPLATVNQALAASLPSTALRLGIRPTT
jgi:alcohol dehydrogenase